MTLQAVFLCQLTAVCEIERFSPSHLPNQCRGKSYENGNMLPVECFKRV